MTRALLFAVGLLLGTIRYTLDRAITLALVLLWVAGWVLAQGFWSTLFAIIYPPWSWYLLVERLAARFGLL